MTPEHPRTGNGMLRCKSNGTTGVPTGQGVPVPVGDTSVDSGAVPVPVKKMNPLAGPGRTRRFSLAKTKVAAMQVIFGVFDTVSIYIPSILWKPKAETGQK